MINTLGQKERKKMRGRDISWAQMLRQNANNVFLLLTNHPHWQVYHDVLLKPKVKYHVSSLGWGCGGYMGTCQPIFAIDGSQKYIREESISFANWYTADNEQTNGWMDGRMDETGQTPVFFKWISGMIFSFVIYKKLNLKDLLTSYEVFGELLRNLNSPFERNVNLCC